MKIGYISADFGVPILGYKGASRHVREIVAAFCHDGHSVFVLSPAVDEGSKNDRESNFGEQRAMDADPAALFVSSLGTSRGSTLMANLHFLPVSPADRHLRIFKEFLGLDGFLGKRTTIRQELRSLLYNLTLAEQAFEYLRANRVDFIYERYSAFTYAGVQVARALNIPHLLEVNAPLADEHEKRRGMELKDLAREIEREIFLQTDRVMVVSRPLQEFVASCGIPASRIALIPNAVDPECFSPRTDERRAALRDRLGLAGKQVIGFVGSLKPWHGTTFLLEAFRGLHALKPQTHLLVIGDGPERQELATWTAACGLERAVTFTGNVSSQDVPDYISTMDVTVAPYLPNDNFYFSPLKIFEYMAMAKPVAAAKIGQVAEVLAQRETGLLFEPGNTEALTAALAECLDDPRLAARLGGQARAWILKERSWGQNAKQVLDLASGIMRGRTTYDERHQSAHTPP